MAKRVCAEPGCPTLIDRGSRCDIHSRARDKARGTRQQRGYDAAYDRARRQLQRRMDDGETFSCWRCTAKGAPHDVDPTYWNLGHDDLDRSIIRGPECPAGNLATASRISPNA